MGNLQRGSAWRSSLITIGVIVLLLGLAASLLPKGFSDDVSIIGQGANVVVLAHNKESVLSLELMTLLNRLRPDYAGKAEFLAVDVATAKGKAFADAQGTGDSVLLLFGPDGSRRGMIGAVRNEAALRAALNEAFGLR